VNAENITEAAVNAASNPKVATAVAAGTASLGAAANFEFIQGALSIASMTVGIATAVVVFAIQAIKLHRVWTAWRADRPEPGDLP
jgi:hypothetical protein